jgi:hypothetical protein
MGGEGGHQDHVFKPGAVVWCFQTTAPNSIELQQPRVWKYMPPEWRNARKGQVTNITYSVKGGFTEAKFVAPNQAVCIFRNYAQDPSQLKEEKLMRATVMNWSL